MYSKIEYRRGWMGMGTVLVIMSAALSFYVKGLL